MLNVDACCLSGPQVAYRNRVPDQQGVHGPVAVPGTQITAGSWNLRDKGFAVPATTGAYWSVLELTRNAGCSQTTMQAFFKTLRQEMRNYGITDPGYESKNHRDHKVGVTNQNAAYQVLQDEQNINAKMRAMQAAVLKEKKEALKLLFVLLPAKEVDLYALLKRVADQQLGIHTVCIVCKQPGTKWYGPPTQAPFLGNVLLKFNLKMGLWGTNQALLSGKSTPILDDDTMLMGADVVCAVVQERLLMLTVHFRHILVQVHSLVVPVLPLSLEASMEGSLNSLPASTPTSWTTTATRRRRSWIWRLWSRNESCTGCFHARAVLRRSSSTVMACPKVNSRCAWTTSFLELRGASKQPCKQPSLLEHLTKTTLFQRSC